MADDKLIQKAGDNAQQIQGQTINVYNGLNEDQVRHICKEMSYKAMEEYTAESHLTVEKRINDFANVLIPRIEKIENGFESFADPEFQLELRKAQVTSACTDEQADYKMLTELLVHRIKKKDNRRAKASISKAIEIVDKIDDESLCGLTTIYSALQFSAATNKIYEGLKVISLIFDHIINSELPTGDEWLNYLDVLDVIRVSSVDKFKPIVDIFKLKCEGYVCIGIKRDSEEYKTAVGLLESINFSCDFLVDHELLDGYVRLPFVNKNQIAKEQQIYIDKETTAVKFGLFPKDIIDVMHRIWSLYSQDTNLKNSVNNSFEKMWNSFDNLKELSKWWNSLRNRIIITPVGEVIAHVNAQQSWEIIPKWK